MRVAITLLTFAFATTGYAQAPADHVALGATAQQASKPDEALQHYQAALAADSLHYEANWRAAIATVEVAQAAPHEHADSLYTLAERYARRALSINPQDAQGHFAVVLVLGARTAVSDALTQLSMARELWEEASATIAADPKHDGAYRALGEWYVGIMSLSDFERNYANGQLGEIAEQATWELAVQNLAKAVELAPTVLSHRLVLAGAYMGAGRTNDAKTQLEKIAARPAADTHDAEYKTAARSLLDKLQAGGAP